MNTQEKIKTLEAALAAARQRIEVLEGALRTLDRIHGEWQVSDAEATSEWYMERVGVLVDTALSTQSESEATKGGE